MRQWRGPRYEGEVPTLGYRVLDWMQAYLPSPADDSRPFEPTDEQALIILRWYALDPLTGRFLNRRAILEMAKGWGKSPLVGAIALAEFAGEVCFDGWDADGEPVAAPWGYAERPAPWVQIAAVSEDQTENTYSAMFEMLVANDHRAATALRIDQGRTRLYLRNRPGQLTPVTAAAGSREGQRVTFGVADETHLWTPSNGGVKLANTLRRNAAKMGGRTFETTNAPVLGEKSVAEMTDAEEPGVLHICRRPSVVPSDDWSDDDLRHELRYVYGQAAWIDTERLLAEIHDPQTAWEDALRFYFNVRTSGAGRAVDPKRWDDLAHPREVPEGEYIGIGFDGSISDDETWLRGCTIDGYRFTIGRWHRPPDAEPGWRIPRLEVAERLDWAMHYFRVGRMFADPFKWHSELEGWAEKYGNDTDGKPRVLALDTNQARRFAPVVDRWLTSIREGVQFHDGDPAAAEHVKASHLKRVRLADDAADGRTRYVIVKGEDRRKIDGAVADALALEAAMTMPPPVAAPVFIPFD